MRAKKKMRLARFLVQQSSKIPSASIDRRLINVLNAGIVHVNRDERVSWYICIEPQLARLVLRCSVMHVSSISSSRRSIKMLIVRSDRQISTDAFCVIKSNICLYVVICGM